ncbi:class II aldolase/adducin family protein [Mycobacteroides abscessus]|uniref:class II aldolase/adducin family protein n=1 Tax=Mycobacteroides abscessus TaxID=36809 RepID=UPI0009A84B55|nr:class II aldolase/adducin family protein [Mycobacteroides abscessus]RIT40857.1 class II aldolase/adducin family protein [Mycobacteroides abscessus]SKT94385.1 putative L-fuculose-phosphate aldolase [Mycobacteroides abscessus subsp. massiliense]SKU20365.1 putative L-fuculose-phosphate aldolase [Mycobacteroides abscessus subsp. massiliense]
MTTTGSESLCQTVAISSRIMAATGAGDLIWGHVSARDPQGKGVWIKQASYGLEEITPERVHLVSPNGEVLDGGGQRHSEYPIHTEIMAARPDIGGVVHVHSRHAVALAASGIDLLPVSHEANFFAGQGVPRFTQTADLILTAELGRQVAATLAQAQAVFLVNHGIVTVGPDLQSATVAAVILERACAQQLLTLGYGSSPSYSDGEESRTKQAHIYTAESIRQVWDYLARGLTDAAPQVNGVRSLSNA